MADIAKKTEKSEAYDSIDDRSIDEMVLESLPVPDRLPPMLFLAALVHGILIIGVTFNAVLGDEFKDAISLEVTIVADPDTNVLEPDRAEYLAQASQEGAGNTQEQARPSARAESVVPVDNVGTESGESLEEVSESEIFADQVLTANMNRLQQSLRSLEEYGKVLSAAIAARFEKLRYSAYTLERATAITPFGFPVVPPV